MSATFYPLSKEGLETLKQCSYQTTNLMVSVDDKGEFQGLVIQYHKLIGYDEKNNRLISQLETLQIK